MRGGKRIGAGRKKTSAPFKNITIRVNPDLETEFREMAEKFKSKNGKKLDQKMVLQ